MTSPNSFSPAATLAEPPAAAEIAHLDSGYGRTTILRDLCLTVPAGQVTALLGPNGAGKTTLLRTLSGFLPVAAGSISYFGEDITCTPAHRRFEQGLCHIPEGRGIFRSLTVRENIVMQSRKGKEKEAIDCVTTAFPILGERLGQQAGTMSGGQQQMLAMSAAHVRDPRLILVDEASLGLAPVIVDEIFAFLDRITAEGTALLLVDQYITRALELAETAYVLRRGEVVYAGPSKGLLDGDLFSHYVGSE